MSNDPFQSPVQPPLAPQPLLMKPVRWIINIALVVFIGLPLMGVLLAITIGIIGGASTSFDSVEANLESGAAATPVVESSSVISDDRAPVVSDFTDEEYDPFAA